MKHISNIKKTNNLKGERIMEKGKCSVCHKSFTLTKNKTLENKWSHNDR